MMSFVAWSFFFFKQKTAYEVRISDWSSDVCSSDLIVLRHGDAHHLGMVGGDIADQITLLDMTAGQVARGRQHQHKAPRRPGGEPQLGGALALDRQQIGRASCRARVCQYV